MKKLLTVRFDCPRSLNRSVLPSFWQSTYSSLSSSMVVVIEVGKDEMTTGEENNLLPFL